MSQQAGYITAGFPGVSPEIRERRNAREKTRHESDRQLVEQLERDRHTVAADGDIDTTVSDAQIGRSMTSADMEKRLRKCNSNLWFEVSGADATKIGVYVIENRPDLLGILQKGKRFVVGMQNGWMPEFSIRHFVNEDIPDPKEEGAWIKQKKFVRETRGWRTVLARLLKERLITASQIERVFKVSEGRSSQNWQAQTSQGVSL